MTLGVILGNRDFFPDALVSRGAARSARASSRRSISSRSGSTEHETKLGAVETWQHAMRAAICSGRNRDRIDGVLVCLPNFGDEKGVADALRLSGLNVPVLVQAYPDDLDQFGSSGGAMRSAARFRCATTCASMASSSR